MQAIITRFVCPTNFRGSRYSARCDAGRITVVADDALDVQQNHVAAADALCAKLIAANRARYGSESKDPWGKPRVTGCLPNGDYCHVFTK